MQEVCQNWEEFEGRLLERYGFDASLRLSKREFMEWAESPGKGRNTSVKRFFWLSPLDGIVLNTSRVLLFIKSVNALVRERVGTLPEMDEGLMADWAVVKGVCSRFDKRLEWSDEGPLAAGMVAGRKLEEPILAQMEEMRRWIESGMVPTDVVKGLSGGAALEELTKMVRDL